MMLRRAAAISCVGAPWRPVGVRLQEQACRATAVYSSTASRRRAASSSSNTGSSALCVSLPSRSSSSSSVLQMPPGHQRQQRRRMLPPPPTAQLRALLSTVPPSKEEEKGGSPATPSAAGEPTTTLPPAEADAEATKKGKLTWKDMLKKHGPVFLVYWNGMWLLSGLTIYAGLSIGGIDPMPLAYAINLDRIVDLSRLDPAHGNVAVAIVLNEVAELVRFPLVVATVPRVTRWWDGVRPEWLKPKLGPDGKPKPTLADQVRRHGPVFVVWWAALWAVGAAGIFGAFEYHLFGDVDALSLARSVNLDHIIDLEAIPPTWGNLGVAVAFNEALEVVRFPLAIATVPYLTRWWEKRTTKTGGDK